LFTLLDLSATSPEFRIYDSKNLSESLREAANVYISKHVQVDNSHNTIQIPNVFYDHYKDFKEKKLTTDDSIKKYLSKYLKDLPKQYKLVKAAASMKLDLSRVSLQIFHLE